MKLFDQWRDCYDWLEMSAEEGRTAACTEARKRLDEIEAEIERLTGRRPPYSTGWEMSGIGEKP